MDVSTFKYQLNYNTNTKTALKKNLLRYLSFNAIYPHYIFVILQIIYHAFNINFRNFTINYDDRGFDYAYCRNFIFRYA